MKISIIVPLHNQAEYIGDCLESIRNQTVEPYETIVVNDGSTDFSSSVLAGYSLMDLNVIHQTNRGLPSARNTGVMNSKGDFILPLDADDILLPDTIERLSKILETTDADVVGLSFREFGLRNTLVSLMPNPSIEDFKTANRIGYCSAIRKDVLLEVGGYSPKMVWGYEDYHLWFNLLSRGKKIITLPEIMWLYRTKEKSMINDSITHHKELMEQIAKDFPDIFPEYKEVKTPLPK